MIKSRMMRWVGYIESTGSEKCIAYKILVGKPLRDIRLGGRILLK
jgi:hypothetical protein